jgi:hypothetical protein
MPSIQRITDQQLKGRFDRAPASPTDVKKTGAPSFHPTTALLIRDSKPDPRRVRTGAQINRVRDDEGARIRAYPRAHQLEGAQHVVFKSQRGS